MVREGCGEEIIFDEAGAMDLKGFSAPVNAYKVNF